MNREIRFRGKSLKDGEFEYGSLLTYQRSIDIEGDDRVFAAISYEGLEPIEVEPNTVGQFTGLQDKNGKDIYEGDIVTDFIHEGKPFGVIEWHNDGYFFINVDFNKKQQYQGSFTPLGEMIRVEINDHPLDVKVIGNIYDTPQLLKGGEE